MKRLTFFLSLLSILAVYSRADQPKEEPAVKHVDAKEAGKLWKANKENDKFIVLDVRTAPEVEAGRIPKSKHIDFRSSEFAAQVSKLDKEKTYLVHCRSGGRSRGALEILKKAGLTKIYHLDGGMLAWEKEGLQVEKEGLQVEKGK